MSNHSLCSLRGYFSKMDVCLLCYVMFVMLCYVMYGCTDRNRLIGWLDGWMCVYIYAFTCMHGCYVMLCTYVWMEIECRGNVMYVCLFKQI
jgi:hypothetical protein